MTAVTAYATLASGVSLRVDELRLDDHLRQDLVEGHLRRIDLSRETDWEAARVEVTLEAPSGDVASYLDDGFDLVPSVVLHCARTNLRTSMASVTTADGDEHSWKFAAKISLGDVRDKVELLAEVSVQRDGMPARRVGRAEPWSMYVDEVARPPFEGTFQVIWSTFSGPERPSEIPERASTESFFLSLDGSVPRVHLNKDFQGLVDLLDGNDARPEVRALRESEERRIATAAWTSAIAVSIASINKDEDDYELPVAAWKADILRWIVPMIYPDDSFDVALQRVRDEAVGPGADSAQALIQLALSQHMKAGDLLAKSVKKVGS